MEFNAADLFEKVVDHVPDNEAIVIGDITLTYKQLDARANKVAHYLQSIGIGKGDHVGIYAYNCVEWVETLVACYKLCAVPINVNYRYVEEELHYLLDDADFVAIVFQSQFTPILAAIKDRLPKLKHYIYLDDDSGVDASVLGAVNYNEVVDQQTEERGFAERSGDDLYVLYTGGTTGMPKGVIWRQEDVIMALGGGIDIATKEPLASPEVMAARCAQEGAMQLRSFQLAPLMHGAAQWGLLRALFEGLTVVFLDTKSFDAAHVWSVAQKEKVNMILITGDAMARPLMDELEKNEYDLSSLFVLVSTAAIFSPSLKDRYAEMLPNAMIMDSIGSTEGGYCGATIHEKGKAAMDSGGPRVDPGRDTVVLDEDYNLLSPGCPDIGILAKGGNVPQGYYKDEEKTRKTFITGGDGNRYVIPGDMAIWHEDGTITLLGRGSNCINSGGEKIFPEEVEGALKGHPDVFDALVVATPDDRFGSCVTGVVALREGASEPDLDSLQEACSKQIARYKLPRRVYFMKDIARAPSGKPNYKWAKEVAMQRYEAELAAS